VDSVARPRTHSYTLTADQARAFLRAAEGDPLGAIYVVALRAGLRESEILGLHWRDVDLDVGTGRQERAHPRNLAEEMKPKLVQTILRHSKISTTMDLYVHAYDDDLRGAVAILYRPLGREA